MSLNPNSEYDAIARRVGHLKKSSSKYSGVTFRFLSPEFSSPESAMSGKGALIESGRWHVSQTHACLYVATTPETALQEALAARRYDNLPDWKSLPRLLVGVKAKLHYLLDLTNGATRQRLRLSLATMLECDWRDDNRFERRESVTQAVGRACYDAGFEGLIVPSQADSPKGVNVVIFPEKLLQADSLRLETPIRW